MVGTIKAKMNVSGKNELETTRPVNVLALFEEIVIPQTESYITEEEEAELFEEEEVAIKAAAPRKIANENQFPDQSIYILNDQLSSLKESLARIKFYLGDIDDLIPR